ncbi:MAG TPA: Rieske 2Fe-2S domain-containing protein [Chloroflexota bacterium]|jgi:phenylpropionate dioxygenase-like ring-hydroxylating dioxygenase large terminal subunit
MLTREQNDLLTRTDRGTPGGDLLRRYWQPVALAAELPPGGPPVPLRVLGEDLVLFRDEQGRPGLMGLHCPHRGADLSYGRLEDGGLRCLYHGWLFDVTGQCREQPGEPSSSTFCQRVRHTAYPCQEVAELIFAYLGPGEPPLLPAYEFLTVPAAQRYVNKALHECNYLQGNEGNIDPAHLSFLHFLLQDDPARIRSTKDVAGTSTTTNSLYGRDVSPTIEIEETDYGVRIFTVRQIGPGEIYVRASNFILPNLSSFPGQTGGEGYSVNWHVPMDDTHNWKFMISFSRVRALDHQEMHRPYAANMTADYRLRRNAANRYQQDREEQRTRSFTGMGSFFPAHDAFATEGEGPIQDRTTEHLGSTDKAIILARRQLLRAVEDAQAGRDPQHVVRDPAANHFEHHVVTSVVMPDREDWRTLWTPEGRAAPARLT